MRLWDREHRRWTARILPGEAFVSSHDEFISAVVGCAIAVCLRDPVVRVGGMRLVLLPANDTQQRAAWGMRSDLEAMRNCRNELDRLIGELVDSGADILRLKVRLFGGMRTSERVTEATAKTVVCVRQFLRERGLPVVSEGLGDTYPRLVSFSPTTGTVDVKRLASRYTASVINKELQYFNSVVGAPAHGMQSKAS
jgi:chemotaxis protein CheD